jgi:hypothetical protein
MRSAGADRLIRGRPVLWPPPPGNIGQDVRGHPGRRHIARRVVGQPVLRLINRFAPTTKGTRYVSEMTIGMPRLVGLNASCVRASSAEGARLGPPPHRRSRRSRAFPAGTLRVVPVILGRIEHGVSERLELLRELFGTGHVARRAVAMAPAPACRTGAHPGRAPLLQAQAGRHGGRSRACLIWSARGAVSVAQAAGPVLPRMRSMSSRSSAERCQLAART